MILSSDSPPTFSKLFQNALDKARQIARDDKFDSDPTDENHPYYLALTELFRIGREEGISSSECTELVQAKELSTSCKDCGIQVYEPKCTRSVYVKPLPGKFDGRYTTVKLCSSCNDKREKQEWEQDMEEQKRTEHPIEKYCYDILGEVPDYKMTFEQIQKEQEENIAYREKLREEWLQRKSWDLHRQSAQRPPADWTKSKAEWAKELRHKKRLQRVEELQSKADFDLRFHHSPMSEYKELLNKIPCRCKAEDMRQGRVCETCRLLIKVHDYTLQLFKDAAQGRMSGI